MASIISGAQVGAKLAAEVVKTHPAVAGTLAVGASLAALPVIAVAPTVGVLNAVGFGSGGVVAGTVVASAQAGIGNVIAPSVFATLTSAGAGGYGVTTLTGVTQVVGGMLMGLAGATGAWGMALA